MKPSYFANQDHNIARSYNQGANRSMQKAAN